MILCNTSIQMKSIHCIVIVTKKQKGNKYVCL